MLVSGESFYGYDTLLFGHLRGKKLLISILRGLFLGDPDLREIRPPDAVLRQFTGVLAVSGQEKSLIMPKHYQARSVVC